VAAILFFYFALDRPSVPLRDSILAGSHHGRPAEILANAGIDASRICVFGPYTTASTINEVLEFNWLSSSRTGIESTDASDLVVAANSHFVSAWTLVPRDVADFLRPDGYGCATFAPLGY
jgi:hypothetical protein